MDPTDAASIVENCSHGQPAACTLGCPLGLDVRAFMEKAARGKWVPAYKVLRNAGYLPDEVAERKEAESLHELLAHCQDERERLRHLHRLDVILARIEQRRGQAVFPPGNDAYYAKLAALRLPK